MSAASPLKTMSVRDRLKRHAASATTDVITAGGHAAQGDGSDFSPR
jgi:hypothetical protein